MKTRHIAHPEGAHGTAGLISETVRLALSVADRAVVQDIESFAVTAGRDHRGRLLWDTRPMTDEREHSPECIDMAREALAYARLRRLISEQIDAPHLLTIVADQASSKAEAERAPRPDVDWTLQTR